MRLVLYNKDTLFFEYKEQINTTTHSQSENSPILCEMGYFLCLLKLKMAQYHVYQYGYLAQYITLYGGINN